MIGAPYMKFLYFDFEYRNNTVQQEIILLSYKASTDKEVKYIDLREIHAKQEVIELTNRYQDHIWVAFNAQADLTCLVSLGADISGLSVIDAMVEAKMISLTHPQYYLASHNLLAVLNKFNIDVSLSAHFKGNTRDLILGSPTYNDAEWETIKRYGGMDVTPLPLLLMKIWSIHHNKSTGLDVNAMIERGEYIKAVTLTDSKSLGFPVNEALLNDIFASKTAFIRHLQQIACNQYGAVYQGNKSDQPMSWNHATFSRLVEQRGYQWNKTSSGRQYQLDEKYLKEKSRQYPELQLLYYTRKTIDAMRSTDLRELVNDGYIKPPTVAFNQKTGRNSPKPSKGFLLNLPPWMRSLIKPPSSKVMIGVDWSQQEIAIAAALSNDQRYQAVYNSTDGDVYLALAKMAGAIPKDATKLSHPLERQTFKAVQLGLGYGKGIASLANDVYAANRNSEGQHILSFKQSIEKAEAILHWHKQAFGDYWDWIDDTVNKARIDGFLKSTDGWTYFVGDHVRNTQLLNFPMQANGAAMMRRAVIHAAERSSFDLICTLHDALYANADELHVCEVTTEVITCMDLACNDILKGKIKIRTDASIYDSVNGYQDDRGKDMLDSVTSFLSKNRVKNAA